jgi:hypothetical protein
MGVYEATLAQLQRDAVSSPCRHHQQAPGNCKGVKHSAETRCSVNNLQTEQSLLSRTQRPLTFRLGTGDAIISITTFGIKCVGLLTRQYALLWVNASCYVVTMNKYKNPLFVTK